MLHCYEKTKLTKRVGKFMPKKFFEIDIWCLNRSFHNYFEKKCFYTNTFDVIKTGTFKLVRYYTFLTNLDRTSLMRAIFSFDYK
jgi:hypothetical protein